jgi:hypothetical protein
MHPSSLSLRICTTGRNLIKMEEKKQDGQKVPRLFTYPLALGEIQHQYEKPPFLRAQEPSPPKKQKFTKASRKGQKWGPD